jgi:protein tyrosine phosphatase (PTP) superfamily phosphohydrolase (DUF442 family)
MRTKVIEDIPGLEKCFQVDNMFFASQPDQHSIKELKDRGVKRVFNLRDADEMDFTEEIKACEENGIEYFQLPVVCNGKFIKENVEKINTMMTTSEMEFLHCGTANRIASWGIIYLVKERGLSVDEALEIASKSGLSSETFVEEAKQIVEK